MIRKIMAYLFGLDYPNKQQYQDQIKQKLVLDQALTKEYLEQQKKPLASVTFFIDDAYNINVKYDWQDINDPSLGKYIAKMLFYINDGQLTKGCMEVLQHIIIPNRHTNYKPSDQNKRLVQDIFTKWQELKEENDVLLRPSDVLSRFGPGTKQQ